MVYARLPLSLRNVEDLPFERGIDICHWCASGFREKAPRGIDDISGSFQGAHAASQLRSRRHLERNRLVGRG